jgi:oxygen-independent coproporphyrinogen-3 oxidase
MGKESPLSIYIHVPFCRRRCIYCDFLSFSGQDELIGDYVAALCADIAAFGANFRDYCVETVFFGGGTPSLLSIAQLDEILAALRRHFNLSPEVCISIEANPETVDKAYLAALRKLGFERLSFGVQSFNDGHLKAIGRLHRAKTAINAINSAHSVGFKDINIDLIFALPNQNLKDFKIDLEIAVSLPITHISCYALTIEDGTPLSANQTLLDTLPGENQDRAMYALAKQKLTEAGFAHYEISNWAKPGYKCRHNLGYWTGRQYLGLGLGASSYFNNKRFKKTDDLKAYISGDFGLILLETLSPQAQMAEFVILGLRLTGGISSKTFKDRFNQDIFTIHGHILNKFLNNNLLTQKGDKIALTAKGIDLSNTVFAEFL